MTKTLVRVEFKYIKPDTPAILKVEYLTVEEIKKIYGIEVTDE